VGFVERMMKNKWKDDVEGLELRGSSLRFWNWVYGHKESR